MTTGDFSEQAAAYERARPGYPDSLVDMLVAEAAVQAGDAVVDFGAGTGIFTRMLVRRQFRVTAVEPNEAMAQRADLSGVRWLQGTFEDNSLAHQSQSWAVAAQAFHWAKPESCLPQIRRILKPNCVLTILWNDRASQDSEILKWTEDLIRRRVPEFREAYRHQPWERVLTSTGDFTFLSKTVVHHTVAMSKSRYLDLWRSHNRLSNIGGPGRFRAFLEELTDYLEQQPTQPIDVPYHCLAWSARRKD